MNSAIPTNERLRHALNTRQADRELMCAEILALQPEWSQVVPRRPHGGPDGGRDIEGLVQGRYVGFAAVGFQNNVHDGPENKRQAKAKFEADLARAKSEQPILTHFVFFTNVDLTPTEIEELKQHGQSQGVLSVDVYNRDRLSLALDSPKGYGIRLRYLGTELSHEEQVAFATEHQEAYNTKLARGFEVLANQLERVEFFQRQERPVTEIEVTLQFSARTNAVSLRDMKLALEICRNPKGPGLDTRDRGPSLMLRCTAVPATGTGELGTIETCATRIDAMSMSPLVRHGSWFELPVAPETWGVSARASVLPQTPFKTMRDFDRSLCYLHSDRRLFDIAKHAFIRVDDWIVHSFDVSQLRPYRDTPSMIEQDQPTWRGVEWTYWSPVEMYMPIGFFGHGPVATVADFSRYTPRRLARYPLPRPAAPPANPAEP